MDNENNQDNNNNELGCSLNMDDPELVTGGGMRTEESYELPEEDEWYNKEGTEWIWMD